MAQKNPNLKMKISANVGEFKNIAIETKIIFKVLNQLFNFSPQGTVSGVSPLLIKLLCKELTPLITKCVIGELCYIGAIDSDYCDYYYGPDYCCGNNMVKELNLENNIFRNLSNKFNNNDEMFSLLSTEIFEDISTTNDEESNSNKNNSLPSETIESINTEKNENVNVNLEQQSNSDDNFFNSDDSFLNNSDDSN